MIKQEIFLLHSRLSENIRVSWAKTKIMFMHEVEDNDWQSSDVERLQTFKAFKLSLSLRQCVEHVKSLCFHSNPRVSQFTLRVSFSVVYSSDENSIPNFMICSRCLDVMLCSTTKVNNGKSFLVALVIWLLSLDRKTTLMMSCCWDMKRIAAF